MNVSLEVHNLVDIFTSWSLVVFHVSVIDRIHVHCIAQEDKTDGGGKTEKNALKESQNSLYPYRIETLVLLNRKSKLFEAKKI